MSQSALDPNTLQLEDIEWFVKNGIGAGLCQVCGNSMKRKARYSEDVAEHFAHEESGTGCPTIEKNRKKYKDLQPSGYDAANAILIKQKVKKDLLFIYFKTGYLTEGAMTAKLFFELIDIANKKRVWEFVGLRLEFIPYLLVCLRDDFYETKRYNKVKRQLSPAKFFIALEPGIRHIDDLWNKPSQIKQKIWRIFPSQKLVEEFSIDDVMLTEPHWFANFRKRVADSLGV